MSLPSIDPEDLRSHAEPARIERIWSRIEADLPAAATSAENLPPRRTRVALLMAASLALFSTGVLVGRNAPEKAPSTPPVATATDESVDTVLAAGSRSRTFSLPGGGVVTLLPGSTMEIGAVDGGVVALRLVQGEAAVETAGGGTVAIEAGEARVSTLGASTLSVRRDERAIDVAVTDGVVEVEAPDGRRRDDGRGGRALPCPQRSAAVDAPHPEQQESKQRSRHDAPMLLTERGAPQPQAAPLEGAVPSATPGWFALYEGGKLDEAAAQLPAAEMTMAIERGRSSRELMALDHLARSKGEKVLAMRALTRVATEFPDDPLAKIAAMTLGNLHRSAGNHLLAAQYDELAKNSQFAEDVACRKLGELEARDPRAADAARAYLGKFPEGRCRAVAEDLLSDAEHDASEAREGGNEPLVEGAPAAPEGTAPPAPPVDPALPH